MAGDGTPGGGERIGRRDFIVRCGKAAAAAGATLGVGAWLARGGRLAAARPVARYVRSIPSFAVAGTGGTFAVARGEGGGAALLDAAIGAAGGMGRFVATGDRVLLKLNCAFSRPAWMGATTSPEVTARLVRLCLAAGAAQVRVTDFPVTEPRETFALSGIAAAVAGAGGKLVVPGPADFAVVPVPGKAIGPWEVYVSQLLWCTKLIGVPTLKTHSLCGASLAMKNWYGFFGGSRSRFHQDIHGSIVEMARLCTPTLVVLDATRMLTGNGPTGGSADDVRPGDTVAVSTDQVAVDAFGVDLLEIDPDAAAYVAMGEQEGIGRADWTKLPGYREVST